MKYITTIIKSAFEDFRRNKLRTFLTSLGILIGVASVILLLAFGLGLKAFIKNQFEGLGSNLIYILPGQVLKRGGGFNSGGGAIGTIKFDEKDITVLKKIPEISSLVGVYSKSINVSNGPNSDTVTMYGITPEYFTLRKYTVKYGKFFEKTDVEKRSKVAVIGPKIAETLFGNQENAIGKSFTADTQNYRVIGVVDSKGGGFGGPDFDSFIYLPSKTAYVFNTDKTYITIIMQATSDTEISLAKDKAKTALLKRYKEDDFSVIEQTEILNTVTSIFSMLNVVLLAIGAISLIVGGVGIMNIMFVTVTERTKEIGVRRAIGAMKKDILYQFISESVVLSLVGGLLGLLVSFVVVLIIYPIFPASIDATAVFVAIGVSSIIGIVFGVFPAKKAADLSPIDAIRYE
jgi:putative ABC transport system permease protein